MQRKSHHHFNFQEGKYNHSILKTNWSPDLKQIISSDRSLSRRRRWTCSSRDIPSTRASHDRSPPPTLVEPCTEPADTRQSHPSHGKLAGTCSVRTTRTQNSAPEGEMDFPAGALRFSAVRVTVWGGLSTSENTQSSCHDLYSACKTACEKAKDSNSVHSSERSQ